MASKKNPKKVGGQAVLGGVMMCSTQAMSVAVRLENGDICVQTSSWKSILGNFSLRKLAFFRGMIVFLETVYNGMCALKTSVLKETKSQQLSEKTFYGSFLCALVLVLAAFVFLPHFITGALIKDSTGVSFQILDGFIKLFLYTLYLVFISRMDDVKSLFQYHGAEHKVIHAYEAGETLFVENVQSYSRIHPRCGTSFIVLLLLVSLLFFMIFLPMGAHLLNLSTSGLGLICLKILFLLPIAGVSYELIQFSEKHNSFFLRLISKPGLSFQKLTTREPSVQHIEVAIAALQNLLCSTSSRTIESSLLKNKLAQVI
ncbi:MAG: DUF1385 domain-containing protein [Deltaproteobacteria bacterium]|nr:DUF1385 domain-containing protein [Deltaproteobacteria bacterium]